MSEELKYEYVKLDFDSAWEAVQFIENGGVAFRREMASDNFGYDYEIASIGFAAKNPRRLYVRLVVEDELTELKSRNQELELFIKDLLYVQNRWKPVTQGRGVIAHKVAHPMFDRARALISKGD